MCRMIHFKILQFVILVKYSSIKMEMAMAHDDHYNSDLPVFYKNYYELPRHQVRTVFSSRSSCAHDVLDTYLLCPSSSRTFD